MVKGYRLKDKRERNRRIYNFWLAHRDWTYASIGGIFHISEAMTGKIIRRQKKAVAKIQMQE